MKEKNKKHKIILIIGIIIKSIGFIALLLGAFVQGAVTYANQVVINLEIEESLPMVRMDDGIELLAFGSIMDILGLVLIIVSLVKIFKFYKK